MEIQKYSGLKNFAKATQIEKFKGSSTLLQCEFLHKNIQYGHYNFYMKLRDIRGASGWGRFDFIDRINKQSSINIQKEKDINDLEIFINNYTQFDKSSERDNGEECIWWEIIGEKEEKATKQKVTKYKKIKCNANIKIDKDSIKDLNNYFQTSVGGSVLLYIKFKEDPKSVKSKSSDTRNEYRVLFKEEIVTQLFINSDSWSFKINELQKELSSEFDKLYFYTMDIKKSFDTDFLSLKSSIRNVETNITKLEKFLVGNENYEDLNNSINSHVSKIQSLIIIFSTIIILMLTIQIYLSY